MPLLYLKFNADFENGISKKFLQSKDMTSYLYVVFSTLEDHIWFWDWKG